MLVDTLFFGPIHGSIGNTTYYVRNGVQIAAKRIRHRNNHRTEAQMLQRAKIANIVATYRLLRDNLSSCFAPDSLPGRSPLATLYNRFTGLNLRQQPVYLTREEARAGGCVAAPYRVSYGALPPIKLFNDAPGTRTDILLGDLDLTPDTPVARFSEAVISQNQLYKQGDSIIYIHLLQDIDRDTGIPSVTAFFHRLRLDADDPRPMRLLVPATGFSSRGGYLAQKPTDAPCAFAWIHTRPTSKGEQASTQQLFPRNPLLSRYTSPQAAQAAIRSYRTEGEATKDAAE